jgi:hypothetical protein
MKKMLIVLCMMIIGLVFMFEAVQAQQSKKFSKEEIKSDFKYMCDTLAFVHYDLYAFTKKEIFDSAYNKIESSITDSLTLLQVYRLFQPYLALAKMSECVIFPQYGEYWGNYLPHGGTVFPLNLGFPKGKVIVKDNFSNEPQISTGDEITSFNRKQIKDFMEGVYNFMSGWNEYYKNSFLENTNFSRFYWLIFGKCDVFQLEIRKKDGRVITIELQAIPGRDYEGKLSKQYPPQKTPRRFRFINNDVAYLYPGDFVNNPGKWDSLSQATRWDNTEFCHFIDSSFSVFRKMKVKNLIIDLRNNQGGDNSFSDHMISYIASKSFSFSSKLKVRTSRIIKEFWKNINIPSVEELKQAILSHENGSRFELSLPEVQPQPDSLRFTGKVYVLINRLSFSNTSSVANIIQDYRFGKLIGEETPDFISAYGATQQFNLPNTQITVSFPKGQFIRPSGDITPQSVKPDYKVEDNTSDGKDEILEYTLDLIKKKNN